MTSGQQKFDVEQIRKDFPILERETREDTRLVYLDSAATSQKPLQVIQCMDEYYRNTNANIHRGVHTLAEEATAMYEDARKRIAAFVNAASASQIIYTRNTTESINLVARTWASQELVSGDVIVLTEMEHHSNLVPWQMLAKEKGLQLEFIPVLDDGTLDQAAYLKLLEKHPRLVAFTHMSNVLGTINPAKEMIKQAHAAGAAVLLDGAQSVPHFPVDVQDLDVDFMAFSGHKMLGPTGIGALYGKKDMLEAMPPFMGGGDMIRQVKLRTFLPNALPHKFEAGTPAIAEGIGFGAAIDYLSTVGMKQIAAHEEQLIEYALDRLVEIPGVKVLGPEAAKKGGVAAFTLDGVHPHDVAQILDHDGIAVRAGHHCAMPLHERFQIPASSRASFYLYNTRAEIDLLVQGIYKVKKIFSA
jgi:cysteine desulfurase/selenocysteine lyase